MFDAAHITLTPTPQLGAEFFPGVIEWSLDGVTYQAGPAPALTAVYIRVTASAGVDVSSAAFLSFDGPLLDHQDATPAGQVVSISYTINLPAGDYVVTILAADEATVIYNAGNLTFA